MEVFSLLSHPLPHLVGHHLRLSNVFERISRPSCESPYATNTSHCKQEKHFHHYPLHLVLLPRKKTHNKTLLFGIILLTHVLHFNYWNQPLNMSVRVCYRDYHEAGLCCYVVVRRESLFQLFFFNLWPVYRLCLVYTSYVTFAQLQRIGVFWSRSRSVCITARPHRL
jgi:hypothetical protein